MLGWAILCALWANAALGWAGPCHATPHCATLLCAGTSALHWLAFSRLQLSPCCTHLRCAHSLPPADTFELKQRALHVYAEKQRVPDFRCVAAVALCFFCRSSRERARLQVYCCGSVVVVLRVDTALCGLSMQQGRTVIAGWKRFCSLAAPADAFHTPLLTPSMPPVPQCFAGTCVTAAPLWTKRWSSWGS